VYAITVPGFVKFARWWRSVSSVLIIDDSCFAVGLPNGRWIRFNWADPNLMVTLQDWRGWERYEGQDGFAIRLPYPYGRRWLPLSAEAFDALIAAAKLARVSVTSMRHEDKWLGDSYTATEIRPRGLTPGLTGA